MLWILALSAPSPVVFLNFVVREGDRDVLAVVENSESQLSVVLGTWTELCLYVNHYPQ